MRSWRSCTWPANSRTSPASTNADTGPPTTVQSAGWPTSARRANARRSSRGSVPTRARSAASAGSSCRAVSRAHCAPQARAAASAASDPRSSRTDRHEHPDLSRDDRQDCQRARVGPLQVVEHEQRVAHRINDVARDSRGVRAGRGSSDCADEREIRHPAQRAQSRTVEDPTAKPFGARPEEGAPTDTGRPDHHHRLSRAPQAADEFRNVGFAEGHCPQIRRTLPVRGPKALPRSHAPKELGVARYTEPIAKQCEPPVGSAKGDARVSSRLQDRCPRLKALDQNRRVRRTLHRLPPVPAGQGSHLCAPGGNSFRESAIATAAIHPAGSGSSRE